MAQNDIDEIYRDNIILDHCRNPRNQTPLKSPDRVGDAINPFCGDEVHLQMNFDIDGHVSDISVMAEGCAINQASSSILSESVKGIDLRDMLRLYREFTSVMKGDSEPDPINTADSSDLSVMYSVRKFPVRIKCVLLSWSALYQIASET